MEERKFFTYSEVKNCLYILHPNKLGQNLDEGSVINAIDFLRNTLMKHPIFNGADEEEVSKN